MQNEENEMTSKINVVSLNWREFFKSLTTKYYICKFMQRNTMAYDYIMKITM